MNIYEDIALRTGGDIYLGVVGPVRTGKSTFIKRFMEQLVVPNITDEFQKQRAIDELPQSAAGKTIMTAEPKFIPEEAVSITLSDNATFRVKLIDCVGYIVPSALGYIENDMPRMVMTPWFDRQVPFNMAAEIGTKKVISDHSTIGIVITTDGTFGELERNEYVNAEKRIIDELKELGKPFIVLMNTADPKAESALNNASALQAQYGVPVLTVNCIELNEQDIKEILSLLIYEFPVKCVGFELPQWIEALSDTEPMKQKIYSTITEKCASISKIKEINAYRDSLPDGEYILSAHTESTDLGKGSVLLKLNIPQKFFYEILSQRSGLKINNDADIMKTLMSLAKKESDYDRFAGAIKEAQATGYGIVNPEKYEFSWDQPEIIKQGGRFGVRLKACAPSIHIIRADIETEVAPIVGTESQSKDLIDHLLSKANDDPSLIWESDIFGKSLYDLVNDGLQTKLTKMPAQAREKMQETLQRVINEGTDGLICIIL